MATDWHLELSFREWVIYGVKGGSGGHVAPASVSMTNRGHTFTLPFTLPGDYTLNGKKTEYAEYRRETKWGWRFKTNDSCHDIGWTLASSEDAALKAAKTWAEGEVNPNRPEETSDFVEAMGDIREFNKATIFTSPASILETI